MTDLFALISSWLRLAQKTDTVNYNAAALATSDSDSTPNVRMVLIKEVTPELSFLFFTNSNSCKGQEIRTNSKAAICFYWKNCARQMRVRGDVYKCSAEQADRYFASRHKLSQIAACVSWQSRPLSSRQELEEKVAHIARKYHDKKVPRPKHWDGYMIQAWSIELWMERAWRLHERHLFTKNDNGVWTSSMLHP